MSSIGPVQRRVLVEMRRRGTSCTAVEMAEYLGCACTSTGIAMKHLARREMLVRARVPSGPSTNSRSSYKLTKLGIREALRWEAFDDAS